MSVFDGQFIGFNRRILERILYMVANVFNVSIYIIYLVMYLYMLYILVLNVMSQRRWLLLLL